MKTITINKLVLEVTPEVQRRIISAINETQRNIDREMQYSEDLRDTVELSRLSAHVAYLQKMLEGK